MGLIGVFSSEPKTIESINRSFEHSSHHVLRFMKDEETIWEFLSYDLPEIVIMDLSDPGIALDSIVHRVGHDAWLHNFGIIGLYDRSRKKEEELYRELKDINLMVLYDYGQIPAHLLNSVKIIEANQQIVVQREFAGRFVDKGRGSFTLDNDLMTVPVYTGLAATSLAQRGLVKPDRKVQLQIALTELIVNGIEHGNCGVTPEEKTECLESGASITELVAEKCGDPTIADRQVNFEWESGSDRTIFSIRDEGDGFDVEDFLASLSGGSDERLHGRGILMARALASKLQYNRKGNEVRLTFDHAVDHAKIAPRGFRDEEVVLSKPGDIIFREGEVSDYLYYISSGSYSVFHDGSKVGTLDPGDIFMGEMSFLLNNQRSAEVRADGSGRLVKVSRKTFVSVVKEYPHYGIFLSKLLARKLVRANAQNARAGC